MPTKIILSVSKGELAGGKFIFDSKDSLILGRQDDCSIVLPESTVSRYHCRLEIAPPHVVVRDFGSHNGTYLNAEMIGQREEGLSLEEARGQEYSEFPMKHGDRLGLGKDCEIALTIVLPTYCADCFAEIDEGDGHENENELPICAACYLTLCAQGEAQEAAKRAESARIEAQKMAEQLAAKEKAATDAKAKAAAESARKEAERNAQALKRKEEEENRRKEEIEDKRKAEQERAAREKEKRAKRVCEVCASPIAGNEDEPNICPQCQSDPIKVMMALLMRAKKGQGDAKEIAGYKNIKLLGEGGMGQVWLVEEEATGQRMALKIMLPKAAASEKAQKMFLREAFLAGQLAHPNVVRQHQCGQSGDTYFILMQLCTGGNLDELIAKSGGKLPLEQATDIIVQVLRGLEYAHNAVLSAKLKDGSLAVAQGIVHRDFKPGNIFLSEEAGQSVALVADFGLSKAFELAGLSGVTNAGDLAGTIMFMPRQQIVNYKGAKPEVDVWAAAASYYYALTGAVPKEFERGKDPVVSALKSDAIPIRRRNAAIPKRLAEVIDHALREKPEIGVQTAGELRAMIEGAR